jgi:putative ABC transport system substrate-binding protein
LLPKRIELLRTLVPDAVSIGFLVNPNNPNAEPDVKNVADIAQAGGWTLKVLKVTKEQELEAAFDDFAKSRVGGVTSGNDALFASWRQQIASLGNRNKLPVIQSSRQFTDAGGLIAYGPRVNEVSRTEPADLPVWYPTQFDLIINLKTAKAIGLTVPPSILARADEVIE